MRKLSALFGCLLLAALLTASPARAQTPTQAAAGLKEAERAYAEVDFEQTRELARAALERGNGERTTTARLYLLWAIAAAALDRSEESRDAFRHVLAANPTLKLDKSLSPKIRAPYLEARGALTLEEGKPPLQATLQRKQSEVELVLDDALAVAKQIELATRASAEQPFTRRRFEPAPMRRVPTPAANELQFFLRVSDAYHNVLFELGTEDSPRRLALGSSSGHAEADAATPGASPTAFYVTAATLGVLGIASGTAAVISYAKREDAAKEWNGSGCEQPGSTRSEQCGDVDERRQRLEYLAIGLGAASGALLIGSVVTLLLAPPSKSQSQPQVGLVAAPGQLGLTFGSRL